MKFLILGASTFFINKVMPSLKQMKACSEIALASKSLSKNDIPSGVSFIYSDYQIAIDSYDADIVYISLYNEAHFYWAKKALAAGKHVIIDKPITTSLKQTLELLEIAKANNLLLSEALYYEYHPQISFIKNILEENKTHIKSMATQFSFPPMQKNNFRYSREMGGGALYDLGPYAASICRVLLDEIPEKIIIELVDGAEVVDAFGLFLRLPSGCIVNSYFGFNSEYINEITLLGDNLKLHFERVYTLPANAENSVQLIISSQQSTILLPIGNAVESYFLAVFSSLNSKDYSRFYDALLSDALVLQQLLDASVHTKVEI